MQYINGNWEGVISGRSVDSDGIEYVVILHKKSWGRISVPNNENPFNNPLFVNVLSKKSERQIIDAPKINKIQRNYLF